MPTRTAAEVRAYAYAGPYGATIATLASQTRRGAHGRDCAAVAWPVVDIRAVDGGASGGLGAAVAEVAKYAVKDGWAEYNTPEDLDTLADVYCALARVRLYASSRWLAPMVPDAPAWGRDCACDSCGTVGWWLAEVRPRGPPGHLPEGYRCAPIPHYAADAPRA
jgi:hypothetical protein